MATAPYQWIKQAQKANEKLTAERNAVNDVYAEYALRNVGQFMPYRSSVASGASPKFAAPYTYAELVYMGQRMFPQETLESLQQQYETQKNQVFTSGKRAGEEQGVSMYINGKYRYTTPSQITQEKIKSLQALSNPDFKSDILNEFLSNLETKEFDPYTGFKASKGYVESLATQNGGASNTPAQEAQEAPVSSFSQSTLNYNKKVQGYNQTIGSFNDRLMEFPKSSKFSPLKHTYIHRKQLTRI